jgi:hypothetical protein
VCGKRLEKQGQVVPYTEKKKWKKVSGRWSGLKLHPYPSMEFVLQWLCYGQMLPEH